jgi:hypothetical protein
MAYQWSYINRSKQGGIINYTLKLVDDQAISQDLFIPVVLTEEEDTEENLNNIGLNMISQFASEITQPIIESSPIVTTEIL